MRERNMEKRNDEGRRNGENIAAFKGDEPLGCYLDEIYLINKTSKS